MRRLDKIVLSRGQTIALAIAFVVLAAVLSARHPVPFWAGGPAPAPASSPAGR